MMSPDIKFSVNGGIDSNNQNDFSNVSVISGRLSSELLANMACSDNDNVAIKMLVVTKPEIRNFNKDQIDATLESIIKSLGIDDVVKAFGIRRSFSDVNKVFSKLESVWENVVKKGEGLNDISRSIQRIKDNFISDMFGKFIISIKDRINLESILYFLLLKELMMIKSKQSDTQFFHRQTDYSLLEGLYQRYDMPVLFHSVFSFMSKNYPEVFSKLPSKQKFFHELFIGGQFISVIDGLHKTGLYTQEQIENYMKKPRFLENDFKMKIASFCISMVVNRIKSQNC